MDGTVGLAKYTNWHKERAERPTCLVLKTLVRFQKPGGIVRDNMYTRQKYAEGLAYGRPHEEDVVEAYSSFMRLYNHEVHVGLTGLYFHQQYLFLAASPVRIVQECGEVGLREVKCPISTKGKRQRRHVPLRTCAVKSKVIITSH